MTGMFWTTWRSRSALASLWAASAPASSAAMRWRSAVISAMS
jgi:hypothetical protein